MKQVFFLVNSVLFILFFSFSAYSQVVIKGTVLNKETKAALAGASVICKTPKRPAYKTATDNNGVFQFRNLPAGDYDIKIDFIGYTGFSAHINPNNTKSGNIEILLSEKQQALDNVSVFSRINAEREASSRIAEKNANNITNVISSQAMERSPDVNAANVLQRMSGVTLQKNSGADESYAIVRGLEPRYNNTLVNGVKITSPDEKSRFVSLDIVPSDLLQRIEVSKSLIPEMEGDAIGGTVNLVMKDAPDTMIFKMIGSIGYSTIFFDRSFDNFSKKDIQQKSVYERFGASYAAQPGDFSRSNLSNTGSSAVPTGILGFTYGKRFFKNKLGFLLADNFQNQFYGSNSVLNSVSPDVYLNKPIITDVSNRTFSTQQLNNGLTLHLDYNFNDRNKIILTNVFLYSYLAQSRLSIDTSITGGNGGRTVPGTGPISNTYTTLTNYQYLENLKIEGKHILAPHFLFDWSGVFSDAIKNSPDRAALYTNTKIDTVHTTGDPNGPYTFKSTPYYFDDISRIWQHNEDKDYTGLANFSYKSTIGKTTHIELKAGGLYRHKERFNRQNEYTLRPTTNSNGVKHVFTDINSAQWIVYTPGGTFDYDVNNYQAFENITAGFGQAKISGKHLDVFGGIRFESTEQGFDINTFIPTALNHVRKTYTDALPSIMLKYKLNNRANIRASYFKSISRPNYYELVPYLIKGQSSDVNEVGNPDLKHSVANNFDLRYEFFPGEEEQLFIGGFYKKIKDPIEYGYVNSTTYKPVNLGDATVYGAELVWSKYFHNIGFSGNYTYIYSKISSVKSYTDLVARTTVDRLQERPMQGQTNNTLNLSVLYRNRAKNMFLQVSYVYLGKTLAVVYPVYGFDYYQQPQSFLSLSAEKQLNRHFTSFGKFNNLLNTPTYTKINDLIVGKDIYKISFSLGLRYSY